MPFGIAKIINKKWRQKGIVSRLINLFRAIKCEARDKTTKLLNIMKNPDQLETLGKAALFTAQQRNWQSYGMDLVRTIQQLNSE